MRRFRARGQAGVTLLELLVAMAITALLGGLIAQFFIGTTRTISDSSRRLAVMQSAQRIGSAWSRDVQNVEPSGVNSAQCPRQAASSLPTPEQTLVSFSWGLSSSGDQTSRTATWATAGFGTDMVLIRRYCQKDVMISEDVLATGIAAHGTINGLAIVHGPSGAMSNDFCPLVPAVGGISARCTISVDGAFKYSLQIARRVPDYSGADSPFSPPAPTISGVVSRNGFLVVSWTPPFMPPSVPAITSYRIFAYSSASGVTPATYPGGHPNAGQPISQTYGGAPH